MLDTDSVTDRGTRTYNFIRQAKMEINKQLQGNDWELEGLERTSRRKFEVGLAWVVNLQELNKAFAINDRIRE